MPRLAILIVLAILLTGREPEYPAQAEFHFVRLEYKDLPGIRRPWGRGWWMQDWPEADAHFVQGVARLTRMAVGEPRHLPLLDDRIFDHPWIYATQAGYWDLSDVEVRRLGEYLRRGGFLVADDFYGPQDWAHFRETMRRVLPGLEVVDVEDGDPLVRVVYEIKERTFIPGLRHLRRGPAGPYAIQPPGTQPEWRAIVDEKGRALVAICFNMDVGDAWEHADLLEYPEAMTTLAYRFGINYIVYAMTQ